MQGQHMASTTFMGVISLVSRYTDEISFLQVTSRGRFTNQAIPIRKIVCSSRIHGKTKIDLRMTLKITFKIKSKVITIYPAVITATFILSNNSVLQFFNIRDSKCLKAVSVNSLIVFQGNPQAVMFR